MSDQHERIEELLAGYALRALSDEDAAEADRLLAEHVPTCERCRELLPSYLEVGGDLALAAAPAEPPELLLPRLRQGIAERRVTVRRRPLLAWGAAVAAAAVVGVVSWNTVALNGRLSQAERGQKRIAGALGVMTDPESRAVPLSTQEPRTRLTATYVPGRREMSLTGLGVPDPAPGHVYRIWLIAPGGTSVLLDEFLPDEGFVARYYVVDLTGYSGLLINEEEGPPGSVPSGETRWHTALEI